MVVSGIKKQANSVRNTGVVSDYVKDVSALGTISSTGIYEHLKVIEQASSLVNTSGTLNGKIKEDYLYIA